MDNKRKAMEILEDQWVAKRRKRMEKERSENPEKQINIDSIVEEAFEDCLRETELINSFSEKELEEFVKNSEENSPIEAKDPEDIWVAKQINKMVEAQVKEFEKEFDIDKMIREAFEEVCKERDKGLQ